MPEPGHHGGPAGPPGQATVEFALVLPAVLLLVLIVVEASLIARDRVALEHAARAGARMAVVDPRPEAVTAAASQATQLVASRLDVTVQGDTRPGGMVTVQVRYRTPIHVPLLQVVGSGPVLSTTLVAQVESPALGVEPAEGGSSGGVEHPEGAQPGGHPPVTTSPAAPPG